MNNWALKWPNCPIGSNVNDFHHRIGSAASPNQGPQNPLLTRFKTALQTTKESVFLIVGSDFETEIVMFTLPSDQSVNPPEVSKKFTFRSWPKTLTGFTP